jgi:beta-N-acetylhexosaminidase
MNRKAIILGIKGLSLTPREKKLFKKEKPWGIILFSRNIKSFNQIKKLALDIKKTFNDKNYPILIDQEGGKVSRINKILDLSLFSQKMFGDLYKSNRDLFYTAFSVYVNTVSNILGDIGININTVPVLDVLRNNSNPIIGTRSFSQDPIVVSKLGKLCTELYMQNKIATVVKHIPGHGLANRDSHLSTPVIKVKKKELMKKDFKPFYSSKSLFAMTAHVVYSAYDRYNTATHSKYIISKVIRNYIKYNGILISDDISMKSLKFSLEENAIRALKAGCNLLLHCNGKYNEMIRLLKVIPKIDKFTKKKTSHFYKFLM